ncbi:BlaI/MecI/CopY family transcriptional regulator [Aeromicrobium piscarium]|uniref:BlaI/MecI/CopY family transcriptional regulator n=1 Tax=Aeromicrobium piscarium TaxID=2590901 RepID=A0A554RFM9_9ACTN|nr:BlaI/MecI/CopY family transcriptional regulator [Aeromicrobium piscarium]TSD52963.1 BlaI/MecI/CopY family transcriptional regulator [Aeromicrobium piscarium]
MRRLGQLETAVMQRLWDWGRSVSVREVVEDLHKERRIAYTTVMTVLDNLHRKGLVHREKHGRAYQYTAVMSREAHTTGLLEDVLDQSPDRNATLLNFVGQLSAEEQVQLRAALAKLDGRDNSGTEE